MEQYFSGIAVILKRRNSLSMKLNISIIVFLLLLLIIEYSRVFPASTLNPFFLVAGILTTIPVVVNAVRALLHKQISVDLLASIALVVSMIKGEWVSVGFINLMITSARIFGEYTDGKAKTAIKSLLKLRPEQVRVKIGEQLITKQIVEIQIGDIVVVELGERVPIDGSVIQGEGSIDQSSLTGESLPVEKKVGDSMLSSTLVVSGSFLILTEHIGKDTTFEKIIALVEQAQLKKGSIQTVANTFASWYIVITFVASITLYIITRNTDLVLSVLLVTCADDIAIAVPMAFFAAIAYAAKRGIIIKGGNYLEGLTRVTTLVVDKTGTLTKGNIRVHSISGQNGFTEERVLELAVIAASMSQHPISKAVVRYANEKHTTVPTAEHFDEHPGKGVMAVFQNQHIVLGNLKLLEEEKVSISDDQLEQYSKKSSDGFSVLFVGLDSVCIGYIALADEIRPEIVHVVDSLKNLGIRDIVMLTGDNDQVASRVMKETGITEYHANLLPEEKVSYIQSHKDGKQYIAMVGDGVNDAAALAVSDIGIAMGSIGSDAAIESADIALMHDNLVKIPEAIMIGRHVMKIARQNFVIWGIVNTIGLILVFSHIIGPSGAAAYNFITDFFPLLNSMRLFRRQHFDRVIG